MPKPTLKRIADWLFGVGMLITGLTATIMVASAVIEVLRSDWLFASMLLGFLVLFAAVCVDHYRWR